ncbi:MAG: 50S ribosomal protein L4 [bacterium]
METELLNIKGDKIGKVELPKEIFGQSVSVQFLHEVIQYYLAKRRAGSASTKTKAEVRGGGAKPWRQKGTGRARVGSIRSPLWRKGGVTFGPKPRSYEQGLPKKKIKKALFQSLSQKYNDGGVKVIEKIELFNKESAAVKTRVVHNFLNKLKLSQNLIIVKKGRDEKFERASLNIPKLKITEFNRLNAYDVIRAENILFEKDIFTKDN